MNRHGTENGERNERMIQEIYQAIKIKENLRENLTKLKQLLKTPEYRERFVKITGKNYDFLMKLLVEEDPKVRKNAAGVLGDLHCQDALDLLLDAYEEEHSSFGQIISKPWQIWTAGNIWMCWKATWRN